MFNLQDNTAIKELDKEDSLGTTDKLIDQLSAAWTQANSLSINKIENINKIVFCGMGASIYGALVIKSLLARELPYPTEIVSDYHLPEWTDENTLVVLTSYSGITEEVLSCAKEGLAENAKMVILTQGGPLAEFAKNHNLPAYIFDGELNTTKVPRFGCGYTILGLIGLLNKVGVITIEEHEIANALVRLREKYEDLKNQAMTDAQLFVGKVPIIFAAEHLAANAQILRNQLNENSKNFSAFYLVPDLNHHLLEGLTYPSGSPIYIVALKSQNYTEQNAKRLELTMDIVTKNKLSTHSFETSGQTVYDDFFETLIYSSFLSVYLALLNGQNPAPNPWVDFFKVELQK